MTRAARAYRLVRCALVVCLLAASGLVLGAGPASAVDPEGITAGTTDPVKRTNLGYLPEQLATEPVYTSRGGWVGGNKFVTNPASALGPIHSDRTMLSETYMISEPGRTYSGNVRFNVKVGGSRVDTDGNGGVQPVRWLAYEIVTYCRYGDLSTSPVSSSYSGSVRWDADATPWGVGLHESVVAGCQNSGGKPPRLVAVEFFAHTLVHYPAGTAPNSTSSLQFSNPSKANPSYPGDTYLKPEYLVTETSRHVWYPGLNHDYKPYDDNLPDYGDDDPGVLCRQNPNAAECDVVNRWRPYEDATDFDKVCKGAPAAEWLSFSWLPEWIGHYASCLFKPKAGFPSDPVLYELEQSTVGTVTTQIKDVADALPKAESCGVVFSSDAFGAGTTFALDTCTWGDWSSAKTWIGYAALVLAGLNGLNMLLGTITNRAMRPDGE